MITNTTTHTPTTNPSQGPDVDAPSTPRRSRVGRRVAALSAVATSLSLGVAAGTAGAAGPPVDRFDGIHVTCEGLGESFLVSLPANDHAIWAPTFVLDANLVLVPVSYEYRLTFTPTGGTPQLFVESASRRTPANATIESCVAHGTQELEDGTYELHLSARLAVHP